MGLVIREFRRHGQAAFLWIVFLGADPPGLAEYQLREGGSECSQPSLLYL